MKIVPLGINGFFPTFGRHTTSFLVLHRDNAILLDAGTGAARLSEPKLRDLLRPFQELHIILSHYHLDHIIGLSYLAGILKDISVSIHAPAPPFVATHPKDALGILIRPPFFPVALDDFPMKPKLLPIVRERLNIGKLDVFIRAQRHPGGSIGVRIDDLVFMTDTAVDEEAIPFIQGAKLLLHEVWLRDEDVQTSGDELVGHSFASGVAEITAKAGVHRLMPIHLNPKRNFEEVGLMADGMAREGLQVTIPMEGEIYEAEFPVSSTRQK